MSESRLTKKQIFLAGVVCSLIVLELVSAALTLMMEWKTYRIENAIFGSLSSDYLFEIIVFSILNILITLASVLVLLKSLLPGWQQHRKWLGWLLGTVIAFRMANFARGLLSVGFLGLRVIAPDGIPNALFVVFGFVEIAIFNLHFFLLLGIIIKKRTEKIAGILTAIATAYLLLAIFYMFIIQGAVSWFNDILTMLSNLGYTILYLGWPVLTRPILEIQPPEKEKYIMQEITITRTTAPKQKPQDQNKLGFGIYYTDHMFLMNYDTGQGWHDARIVPYAPISLDPAAMCLHYGQEVFEGLKAYYGVDGKIRLFRPEENMARLNLSCERLCIPKIDEALGVEAIEQLVQVDKDWIPTEDGTSLYIRPFIFATEAQVGVHPARELLFVIILSPVGAYYPEGLNPVKIYIEQNYVRAVKGGLGFTKAGANYASSLKAQEEAQAQGYTQVLWLDGVERKYIEEVGTMNVFFVIGDEVVTPALQGSILSGITRKSCIDLLRSWGMKVTERPLALEELLAAAKAGQLKEAFGSGTAAVISPIGELRSGDETLIVNNGEIGGISQRLYDELTGIQWGKAADPFGWTKVIA